MANDRTLQYEDAPIGPKRPNPFETPSEVDVSDKRAPVEINPEGYIKIERPDGSVVIDLNPHQEPNQSPLGTAFDRNLAEEMDDQELNSIAADILEGVDADERSRKEWMDIRSKGIAMLALKIEEPSGDASTATSGTFEGMAKIRHSLMLEATVAFQAGARGELLPAAGPVKVENTAPPDAPMGAPDGDAPLDELANALEKDFNRYLTRTAKEYVPDTDRMFFKVAYGGDGFKKLFHCPLKRRPVSESVDAEDLIVSNMATDLSNCGRITHRIKMRKSTLRRMQIVGAYRDIDLVQPVAKPPDEVEQKKADVGGYKTQPVRPQDTDYEIYECYVELDLPRFAPKHLSREGLPLPYKVSIETTSRRILEIRRNWREKDRQCLARQVFVQFPFIRGLGFYGLGFVHLLGNSVMALTAAYRLMLDAGMFANFPGFVFDKQVGRQLTNWFRTPPGGGTPIDLPSGKRIQDVLMAIPYKEVGPAFPAFIQHLEDRTKQLAMVANSSIGEGKQDAPVGTTLALLEQATKIEASAFKRLHDAQAEEFAILKELFQEDPEAMWRHNKSKKPVTWQRQQFLQALESYELQPVADPNNPTSLHRAMKASMLKMLAQQSPMLYDMIAVDKRVMSMANIDPTGVFKPPQPNQPDPMMIAMQMRMQMMQLQSTLRQQEQQLKAAISIQEQQGRAADRASKERIEQIKADIQRTRDQEQLVLERLKMNADAIMHVHGLMMAEHKDRQMQQGSDRDRSLKERQFGHQQTQDNRDYSRQQAQDEHQRNMDQINQMFGGGGGQPQT